RDRINLDMIGRNSVDSIFMVGSSRCPDLAAINIEENRYIGLALASDDKAIGGSDHMSFYSKKIPFLFYFSGLHEDYHQVTDNPELINLRKVTRVSQLAFRTAWRIANDNRRYTVISK
ncbi:MAG: M28 family peptidase, partial [Ignavibacteria bacterium]|nr:M28 family peptidase [Ignavibacteria bacterium]